MSEVNEPTPWRDDVASFVNDVGIGVAAAPGFGGGGGGVNRSGPGGGENNWQFHAVEFGKGLVEMSVEFGKGVRDVVKQSVMRENSFVVRKFGPPFKKVCNGLSFLNEYLPEDRDPAHSWSVIFFVLFVALAVKSESVQDAKDDKGRRQSLFLTYA